MNKSEAFQKILEAWDTVPVPSIIKAQAFVESLLGEPDNLAVTICPAEGKFPAHIQIWVGYEKCFDFCEGWQI